MLSAAANCNTSPLADVEKGSRTMTQQDPKPEGDMPKPGNEPGGSTQQPGGGMGQPGGGGMGQPGGGGMGQPGGGTGEPGGGGMGQPGGGGMGEPEKKDDQGSM
jgi:hypothetical protein